MRENARANFGENQKDICLESGTAFVEGKQETKKKKENKGDLILLYTLV